MDPQPPLAKIRLFYSYSHKDDELRIELEKHLILLQRQNLVASWNDRKITPGSEWKNQIDGNLARAQIILLLVSADFLASDYCYDVEMKLALDRHEAGDALVVPIILRPVDWGIAPFAKLQALPKDATPVTLWTNRDEAFADISRGIRALILRLQGESISSVESSEHEKSASGQTSDSSRRGRPPESLVSSREPMEAKRLVTSLHVLFGQRLQEIGAFEELEAFELMLDDVPLQGTDKPIPCAVPRTNSPDISRITKRLAEKAGLSFGLLFAGSPEILEAAMASVGRYRIAILGPLSISKILDSVTPIDTLVGIIRKQMGLSRLNPYHVANPAGPNMFFGRNVELSHLINDPRTHFAIVGPSRVGKSSLLQQYLWQIRHDYVGAQAYYLNAYHLGNQTPDACAREIALLISASSEANRVGISTLGKFLRHKASALRRPIDLLIDECDSICQNSILDHLGEAAKEGSMRLILCGRDRFLRYCESGSKSFALRLGVVRLGPLEHPAAVELLTKPMKALGLTFESGACVEHCCQMAGQMPDLLQFYGRALVDSAIRLQQEKLSMEMILEVERTIGVPVVGVNLLDTEQDSIVRLVMLCLLDADKSSLSVDQIVEEIERHQPVQRIHIPSVLDYLFLNGFLAYEGHKVKIANGFLKRQARKLRRYRRDTGAPPSTGGF